MLARAVIAACLAVGAAAGSAEAATTFCVGVERAGCTSRTSAGQAFADAVDGDTIELGAITVSGPLASGEDVIVAGAGEGRTALQGGLTLGGAGAQVSDVTAHGLKLAGTATRVHVDGLAEVRGSALLRASLVSGDRGVDAVDGTPRLESVLVDVSAGPGLRMRCDATLHARHVTLVGTPAAAVTTVCDTSLARISDSNLWPSAGGGFSGPGRVVTDHTNHRAVPGHAAGPGDLSVEPGFAAGSARLAPGSPLADAGGGDALAASAWPEDRSGLPRIADGNGDGALVRDLGAFELAPPAVPLPDGNLLGDPGAEHGGAWTLSGGFVRERYGVFPFPSVVAGTALGAGEAFFAGGTEHASAATQVVSVHRFAPEIDGGGAGVSLSALLGGYRGDGDAGAVEAAFLDPADRTIATVALAAPSPAERAQVTSLLPRGRSDAIPPLTRTIAVTLRATRATRNYNDAYFDNVALVASAPGAPPPRDASRPARPFAGLRLLTARARLDRRRRVALRVACVARTVGRCRGVVTLAPRRTPTRLAGAAVRLRAGAARRVRLRLPARPGRRRTRLRVYTAARDGQGVVRTSVAPLVVLRRGRG
jgi:hypothetical protein